MKFLVSIDASETAGIMEEGSTINIVDFLMRATYGDTPQATAEGMAFMDRLRSSPEPQTIQRPSGSYTFKRKETTT